MGHLSEKVLAQPVGRDVLARARLVELVTCAEVKYLRALTRPVTVPDFGHSVEPLIVELGDTASSDPLTDSESEGCVFDSLYSSPDEFLLALFDRD